MSDEMKPVAYDELIAELRETVMRDRDNLGNEIYEVDPIRVEAADAISALVAERDAQYDDNVARIAGEGAAILRAEAAETALAEAQARSAGNWRNLQRLWALARGDDPDGDPDDRPRCRDCADNFNVCPDTGLSCDPQIATEQRLRGLAEAKAEVERLREYFDATEDLLYTGLMNASSEQLARRTRARAAVRGSQDDR